MQYFAILLEPPLDIPLPLDRHHLQPGLNKNHKNTSNTRVIYWGRKLLSLWNGGIQYKLDALVVSTEGRSQLGGMLLESTPLGGKSCYDATKEQMVFYVNQPEEGPNGSSRVILYEFNKKFKLTDKT